jgi:hypothetical protein
MAELTWREASFVVERLNDRRNPGRRKEIRVWFASLL